MRYFIITFLVVSAICITMPLAASAADYQGLMSLGKSSLKSGDFAAAEKAFSQALDARPGDRDATLHMGIALSRQGKYKQAKSYLKLALFDDPTDPLVNFELGKVFQQEKVYVEARDFFESVTDIAPGTDHAREAEKLLNDVNRKIKSAGGRRYSIGLSTGVQYDTNVVLNAEGAELPEGVSHKDDVRALVNLAGSYQTPDYRGFKSSIGYSFYQSMHKDLSRFNVQSHTLRLGALYDITDWLHFRGTYSMDYTYVGSKKYSQASIFAPSLRFKWNNGQLTVIEYKFSATKFKSSARFPTNGERSGDTYRVSLSHTVPMDKNIKVRGSGYFQNTNTRAYHQKYDAYDFAAAVMVSLPYKIEMEAGWDYLHKEYEGAHPISGLPRTDDVNTFSLTLKKHILSWLSIALNNTYIRNESNIVEFDYNRNISGVILTARY